MNVVEPVAAAKQGSMLVGIVVGLLVTAFLILLFTFNGLTQQRDDVRIAWSQMDDQLKRRYDLIPSLILAVQPGGAEVATKLNAVIAAKNKAAIAFSPAELATAEAALSAAIRQVMEAAKVDALVQRSGPFKAVRHQIDANVQSIDQAQKRYNDQIDGLNAAMHSFPTMFTAKLIGIRPQAFFEISA